MAKKAAKDLKVGDEIYVLQGARVVSVKRSGTCIEVVYESTQSEATDLVPPNSEYWLDA